MRVLVTGAGGFLGRHLVSRLVAQGDSVTALVWPAGAGEAFRDLPVKILEGNICSKESVGRAMQGQEIVFHCAGKVDDWGPRQQYYEVNVEGTRNLLEAGRAAGVRHFIHISSLVVLGIPEHNPVDESMPYTGVLANPYLETKMLSEKLVRDFNASTGLPATIIRPGILWGPGDTTIFPRMARLAKLRMLLTVGRGDNILCITYVPNLVDALLLAARVERPDCQIYHIADAEHISSKQYFQELAAAIGVRQPPLSIPFGLAYASAYCSETFARLMQALGIRYQPLLTCYGLYLWSTTMIAPPAKARELLGYEQKVGFKEGMKNLAGWYATGKF